MTESAEVVRPDCGCGLDLDADDLATAVLHDRVYLDFVFRPVVEEPGPFIRPRELPGEFHQHEAFEQRPKLAAGPQQVPDVRVEQARRDPRIDKGDLGSTNGALAEVT